MSNMAIILFKLIKFESGLLFQLADRKVSLSPTAAHCCCLPASFSLFCVFCALLEAVFCEAKSPSSQDPTHLQPSPCVSPHARAGGKCPSRRTQFANHPLLQVEFLPFHSPCPPILISLTLCFPTLVKAPACSVASCLQ